jgi:superfamily II DNA helicase RecQ
VPAVGAVQSALGGQSSTGWTLAADQQIQATATRLQPAPADVRQNTFDLMQASHDAAQRWEGEGRSPFLQSGIVDPRFVDDVIQQAPAVARAFTVGQAKAGIPADQQLRLDETVALGATRPPVVTPVTPEPSGLHPVTPTLHPVTPATPAQPATAAPADVTYDPALFEQLRTWRRQEADRQGKAAFHVFPDATLQRIAATRPQTEEELLAVKGVGPKKLASFGQGVLNVTRDKPEGGDTT